MPDPIAYYDLERYLFDAVGPRLRETGELTTFDFFSIIVWKANRAKSRVARLLLKRAASLDDAARSLAQALAAAPDDRERMRVLLEGWGFRLPMACAILTVLWPEQFSVYDVRVCEQLARCQSLADRTKFETLWTGYREYIDALVEATPPGLSLRDRDRWLWAKSAAEQLERDLNRSFGGR